MMKYVIDDSAMCYMLEDFPKKAIPELFQIFCKKCEGGDIVSDKETKKSLERLLEEDESYEWLEEHSKMFKGINQKEAKLLGVLIDAGKFEFVAKYFSRNLPIAIPFIITIALSEDRTIVINKKARDDKFIKKICREESIRLIYIDDFLSEISDL